MRAKILIDNIAAESFVGEWGLAVWIEYGNHKLLLDTGTTGVFAENARRMDISLDQAELCVISHGHYDHADGLQVRLVMKGAGNAAGDDGKLLRAACLEMQDSAGLNRPGFIVEAGFMLTLAFAIPLGDQGNTRLAG